MASMSTKSASSSFPLLSSSSSSSSNPQWKYNVFLSFSREDTGKNFTDHLFAALNRNGIHVFRDHHEKYERGKVIESEIFKAIQESRISIIIFSRTYASSTGCLDELVKIMECKHELGQTVVPVFYDVDPSDIRKQASRNFKEAFAKHEEAFKGDPDKVQRWRMAMTEAGNLSGFHLKDRHESEFIQDIIKDISSKLSSALRSFVDEELVGMNSRLEKLISLYIGFDFDDVRFVGICGMGGIGKTTLARVVHDQMSCHFEGSSFLANVREASQEGRVVSLQKQLLCQVLEESDFKIWDVHEGMRRIRSRLCCKKVLVIVDDVNHIDQLNSLAGSRDWFGLGSRIIITTRDEHLLTAHRVDAIYKAQCLNPDEALQLFNLRAFNNCRPLDSFLELSKHVVNYANGLPLALKVLGSFFSGRSEDQWISALERLRENSDKEILDRLQIGFDGLDQTEKDIFLDIALFFNGKKKDLVTKILDSCGFHPNIGINVLIEKCLITVSPHNELSVHDLLQEMAKKIVKEESPTEPGRRSRLWNKDEVCRLLTNNMGTEEVQGIAHKFLAEESIYLSAIAFSNMKKLRVLKISDVLLPHGLDYLSNELRYLEWHGYSLKTLPSRFEPDKIVVLDLSYCRIHQLWSGIKPLNKLKIIDLSYSQNLTKMPDFTGIPNLESLILEGCSRLSKLHPSIGFLKRLVLLDLKDCRSLSSLPSFSELVSLEVCIISGCSKLDKFPDIIQKMESLKELDLSGTAITEFPLSSFELMENLEVLSFRGCRGPPSKFWQFFSHFWLTQSNVDPQLLKLPSLSGLCNLKRLDVSDCNLPEGAIPTDLGCLSSLRQLNLSENNFVNLPTSISQLEKLQYMYINNCKRLKSLPQLPPNIGSIYACNCTSLEALPDALKLVSFSSPSLRTFNSSSTSNVADIKAKILQHRQIGSNTFYVVYPGSEIPDWFSHQTAGSSTSVERPAPFLNIEDNKLIGLAVCCMFAIYEPPPNFYDHFGSSHRIDFVVKGASVIPICKLDDKSHEGMSDHLWLFFVSQGYFNVECGEDCSPLVLSFIVGNGSKVKKFGIRPVYKHDEDEFKQIISKCNNSGFDETYGDLHQDM